MEKHSSLFSFTSYDVIDEKDKLLKKRKVDNDGNFLPYQNLFYRFKYGHAS